MELLFLSAGVGRLYIVHADPETTEKALVRARTIFPETHRPKAGDRIEP